MEYCNNPITARFLMAQSLQEWMFGGIPPGENKTKHTTSNEVLAEGKGNMEWVVEEGSCKYQL